MKQVPLRRRAATPMEDIPLRKLVPSEPMLEKAKVDAIKAYLNGGNTAEPPRVSLIGEFYYVHDGNHRIMALKQTGHTVVRCKIQPHKSRPNVANPDEHDCKKMVAKGYAGFKNLRVGSRAQKMKGYEEEETEDFLEGLEKEVI